MRGDTQAQSGWLAGKIVKLRIFPDDAGRMNRSLADIGGAALIVSQFTLAAETKGNRPGFSAAAPPDEGERLYEHFSEQVRAHGVAVSNGIFGADMKVSLVNDGPVTICSTAKPGRADRRLTSVRNGGTASITRGRKSRLAVVSSG